MNAHNPGARRISSGYCRRAPVISFVLLLAGCAGTKVLDEPTLPPDRNPLAVARDRATTATLDWVIVRDGPGTWAKNADWDQYLLRLENRSTTDLRITEVYVEDSMGTKVFPGRDRKGLIAGSKQALDRYQDADIKVKAGTGTAVMAATVMGTTLVGGSVVGVGLAYTSFASLLGISTSFGAAVTAAGAGLVLVGPAMVIRNRRNQRKVDARIQDIRSRLPFPVEAGMVKRAALFFPISPSPRHIVISYRQGESTQTLRLETRESLAGLHLGRASGQ
ncbi:MAG: hypothetical protein NZ768_00920 [Pseudomonadales bacterium]|nr:hypothetical protein [Pseudomonadales bacterium]